MKKNLSEISNRELVNRIASRTTLAASLMLFAVSAGLSAGAAQADSNDKASCREETKRVAVWPKGPKGGQARFEDREVTICDGKIARRSNEGTRQANDSGD